MFASLILVGVVFFLMWMKPRTPKGFPPGPLNLPFVGGMFGLMRLGNSGTEMLTALGKIYGPISGLYFGNKTKTIVINDFELAKEIAQSDKFSHRPRIFQLDIMHGPQALGVFFSNGELWREQRRFTLRTLRDFGFGKTSMETLIHEEAEETIKDLLASTTNTTDWVTTIHDKFGISVINILWAVVAGERFSHEDVKLKTIMNVIWENFRSGNSTGNLINDYPWLRHVPIVNRPYHTFVRGFRAVNEILEKSLNEHKATRDTSHHRDFFDVYLSEMEKDQQKNPTTSTFSEKQMIAIAQDLFNAGAESTSNTVAFALLYMLLYPEVQTKVHEELDKVVGHNRLPSMDDKPKLHYLEAVMAESYRLSPIAPTYVPRTNLEDVPFHGYIIPKNAFILITIQSIQRDPTAFEEPDAFKPERHLDSEGKFVKNERIVPFGMGKRACLGEPLAKMSAFLLFAAIMQKFTFALPEGSKKPSTVPVDGFTVAPQPFSAKITPRF